MQRGGWLSMTVCFTDAQTMGQTSLLRVVTSCRLVIENFLYVSVMEIKRAGKVSDGLVKHQGMPHNEYRRWNPGGTCAATS